MPKQRDIEVRIAEMESKLKVLRQIKRINDERAKLANMRPRRRRRAVEN